VDLDARRKQRTRAPKTLTVDGETYPLAPALPVMVGELLAKGEILDALTLILGAENAQLLAPGFDIDDLTDLCTEEYGISMGESPASSSSSKPSGARSRPTSKRSTTSS